METIYVVFGTDENYAQHTGVAMLSLLHNMQSENPIVFLILFDRVTPESQQRLRSITDDHGAELTFIEAHTSKVKVTYRKKHISNIGFARMLMSDFIPEHIDKLLYIDTDTIVRHDVAELWDTDIRDYAIAAAEEPADTISDKRRRKIGLPLGEPYFNSGVLLMNMRKWRADAIEPKLIEHINKPDTLNDDQATLNVVLCGQWLHVHPKWNLNKSVYTRYYSASKWKFSNEILQAVRDPAIMHFTAPRKAWHFSSRVPFAHEYMDYVEQSPWKGYRYPDVSLKSGYDRYRWFIRRTIFGGIQNLFK